MAKRLFAFALALIIGIAVLSSAVSAGSFDGKFKNLTLQKFRLYDSAATFGAGVSMRGYTASEDGKYLFGGFLTGTIGVVKFDAKTGDPLAILSTNGNFPKGLASDDRGNLIVGLATKDQKDRIALSIVDIESMKEISQINIEVGSGKVGVNGVTVVKEGGKYYAYCVVNYDFARIYKVDITDTKNPAVVDGYIDLAKITKVDGCEGQYLDSDGKGNLYLSILLDGGGDKADMILKLTTKGEVISSANCTDSYGISYYGGYILTATYQGADSCVYVFDAETMMEVAKIPTASADHSSFSGISVFKDRIIVAEQSYDKKAGFWTIEGLSLPDAPASTGSNTPAAAPATTDPILGSVLLAAASGAVIASISKKRR